MSSAVSSIRIRRNSWDINDSKLPTPPTPDSFNLWPNGQERYIYSEENESAKRHISGWAMRNTNNHNASILKKSCLGVLMCSSNCCLSNGHKLTMRPAICDKARRKQCGKPCRNQNCRGYLVLIQCRGHGGYPVTHFWKHCNNAIYFQSKGSHDHPMPDLKPSADFKRAIRYTGTKGSLKRVKSEMLHAIADPSAKFWTKEAEKLCSCPPFECLCKFNVKMSISQSSSCQLSHIISDPAFSTYTNAESTKSNYMMYDDALLNCDNFLRLSPPVQTNPHDCSGYNSGEQVANFSSFELTPPTITSGNNGLDYSSPLTKFDTSPLYSNNYYNNSVYCNKTHNNSNLKEDNQVSHYLNNKNNSPPFSVQPHSDCQNTEDFKYFTDTRSNDIIHRNIDVRLQACYFNESNYNGDNIGQYTSNQNMPCFGPAFKIKEARLQVSNNQELSYRSSCVNNNSRTALLLQNHHTAKVPLDYTSHHQHYQTQQDNYHSINQNTASKFQSFGFSACGLPNSLHAAYYPTALESQTFMSAATAGLCCPIAMGPDSLGRSIDRNVNLNLSIML